MLELTFQFSSVQSLSHVQLFATPRTSARQASLSITNSRSLFKLMSIESVTPSNISFSVVPFSHLLIGKIWWHVCMLAAQSCLTACDPMDCSPPGSSIHGIFQVRILEWLAISFSRDLPHPGIELASPTLQADSLPTEPQGKPRITPML